MSRSLLAILLAALIGVAPAAAQDSFSSKPIRIVLPVPPGSALDIATRAVAEQTTAFVVNEQKIWWARVREFTPR